MREQAQAPTALEQRDLLPYVAMWPAVAASAVTTRARMWKSVQFLIWGTLHVYSPVCAEQQVPEGTEVLATCHFVADFFVKFSFGHTPHWPTIFLTLGLDCRHTAVV